VKTETEITNQKTKIQKMEDGDFFENITKVCGDIFSKVTDAIKESETKRDDDMKAMACEIQSKSTNPFMFEDDDPYPHMEDNDEEEEDEGGAAASGVDYSHLKVPECAAMVLKFLLFRVFNTVTGMCAFYIYITDKVRDADIEDAYICITSSSLLFDLYLKLKMPKSFPKLKHDDIVAAMHKLLKTISIPADSIDDLRFYATHNTPLQLIRTTTKTKQIIMYIRSSDFLRERRKWLAYDFTGIPLTPTMSMDDIFKPTCKYTFFKKNVAHCNAILTGKKHQPAYMVPYWDNLLHIIYGRNNADDDEWKDAPFFYEVPPPSLSKRPPPQAMPLQHIIWWKPSNDAVYSFDEVRDAFNCIVEACK
jgi:hypothetical protein